MKLDSLDIDKFVTLHACKEVSNPIFFVGGNVPTPDGLFSHEIFGRPGSKERKTIFAYINLKKKFVHPVFYKMFISMDKKVSEILSGTNFFVLTEDGKLKEDKENGKTGVTFFYQIFDKLKFENTGTFRRSNYISLLKKLKKDDIFIDKFLVIPPFLRDYDPSKTNSFEIKATDEVNDKYAKLIRFSKSLTESEAYDFMTTITESNVQNLLYEIYKYFVSKLSKKTGMIHQSLLGKGIDYATRSVISSPNMCSMTYKDLKTRFGFTGIPLSQIAVLFYPFFVKYIQDFIYERENEISFFEYKKKKIEIKNLKEQFTEEKIKKDIALYIKSVESRFKTITVKDKEGNEYPINLFRKELKRNFTLTDLLFVAAKDICKDKHVYITRYPVEQYQNIYPSRIAILSTTKTVPVELEDRYLPDYPLIFPDYPCEDELFCDTVVMNNSYLLSLGADYDGDTISLRGVFTKEANEEAEKLIYAKTNFFDQQGRNSRVLGNEAIQTLYALTRDYK